MHRQSNPRLHNVVSTGLLTFSRLGRVKLEDIPSTIQFDRVCDLDLKNQDDCDRLHAQFTSTRRRSGRSSTC